MRLCGLIALLVMLSACAPSISDVSGTWLDEAAELTTCGETFPVTVGLELTQAGTQLTGTFSLMSSSSAFIGRLDANSVIGDVRGDDGSGLVAALTLQQNRLAGTFTATEEISCTAGGASVTVYEVDLAR